MSGIASAIGRAIGAARSEIRTGRFQRSMSVVVAFSAIVSGWEAFSQHSRGDFSDRWMWTPVWLMPPAAAAAGAAVVSSTAARVALPAVSAASIADGAIGFALHLRGIARMPGGYRLGQYNVVMGPPVFAPLLMSSVGVLGLMAAGLRREEAPRGIAPAGDGSLESRLSHGRFQQGMALTAAGFAILSGGEAYFEHLRGSYNDRLMWTPVLLTPPMVGAALGAALDPEAAGTVLPLASAVTFADGLIGFFLHMRGALRMPGGLRNLRFNLTYGPPLFAPLLLTSVGLLGIIASLLRRGRLTA